jgi:hypothetical protein
VGRVGAGDHLRADAMIVTEDACTAVI